MCCNALFFGDSLCEVLVYGTEGTLVVVEEQSFPPKCLQQGCDLGVLKLDKLLLSLLDESTEGGQQDLPRREDAGHARRRISASLRSGSGEFKRPRGENLSRRNS